MAENINFDPNGLKPIGEPSRMAFGVSSGDMSQEFIEQTPFQGPDGRTYVKQQVIGNDGNPRGAPSFVTERPGDGQVMNIRQGPQGWVETEHHKRTFGEAVFEDKKLMTFVAIATAGAAAGTMTGGAGGAGGSMLGSGTGATPGVVAGGTMGTPGLAATGAATVGGVQGLANSGGNAAADELFQSETMGTPTGPDSQGTPDFWNKLRNWITTPGGSNGGMDGLMDLFGGGQNLIRDAGSLALMKRMYDDNKDNAQEWRTWMEQGTPDLGFYQGKLKQSYEDPASILNGPEFQAAQNVVHNKLQRSDAAGGRLANDFGRQSQLQDHAMGFIDKYRGGLANTVNTQQQTRAGIGSGALENAQAADTDWMKNLMNWLNSQGN